MTTPAVYIDAFLSKDSHIEAAENRVIKIGSRAMGETAVFLFVERQDGLDDQLATIDHLIDAAVDLKRKLLREESERLAVAK